MARIGVFLSSPEGGDRFDLTKVEAALAQLPHVVACAQDAALRDATGLPLVSRTIADKGLDGALFIGCDADAFELTYLPALVQGGVDADDAVLLELEGEALAGDTEAERTDKLIAQAGAVVAALAKQPEHARAAAFDVAPRALVIGGGIGGIQAALDIANSGFDVYLVEREPSIGGHMIQLSETFPTLDCSQCILTPRMVEAGQHPKIHLRTYSEVQEISGKPGRYKVKILHKPRYVTSECTACGDCLDVCPVLVTDQFNTGLQWRKAIYQPCPQAVPSTYTLDIDNCLGLNPIACGACEKACEKGAIDYDMEPVIEEVEVGAVVVATGYDLYTHANIGEYGYGKYADVVNGLQFERMLSASGPTKGKVVRPSDGTEPKEVVFIQCVRSRDPERGMPYCSSICCMYTAKHAMLYKHNVHDGQAYIFYMDIRAGGKGYEEFIERAVEEDGAVYLRGRVSRVFEEDGKIVVWGADTLTGKRIEVKADLVVLATAIVPNDGHEVLRKVLNLDADEYGFLKEAHLKTSPLAGTVPGFFLVGCCDGPKDIPATVAQASGAAAKVCAMFTGKEVDEAWAEQPQGCGLSCGRLTLESACSAGSK